MRPYFAIIVDSFRAAFASSVLYVLLGMIVLLLLVIAPIRMTESLDWKLSIAQIPNVAGLTSQLIEQGETGDRPSVRRVWEMLSESNKTKVKDLHAAWLKKDEAKLDDQTQRRNRQRRGDLGQYFSIVDNLNEIIKDKSFYREQDWVGVSLDSEAQSLIEEGPENLSEERMRRLNRLLIGRAFPGIERGAPTTLSLAYGPFTADWLTFSATREFAIATITENMTWLFDKFVLSIGLGIGILVTANIVPETFDSGSLNLLLSKPISRWGLFVTKFIGGCVLIAICSVLLFSGLWLWMGMGLGLWDPAMLWSIPIYILAFAIYFSVSAFVGLVYRSSILAVVVTIVFWIVCFVLGSTFGFFNARMENVRLYDANTAGDRVLALDGFGNLVKWDDEGSTWKKEVSATSEMGQEQEVAINIASWMANLKEEPFWLSPKTDAQGRCYAGIHFIADLPFRSHQKFYYSPSPTEPFKQYGKFPRDAIASFVSESGLTVVDRFGEFYFLDPKKLDSIEPTSDDKKLDPLSLPNMQDASGNQPKDDPKVFEQISPENPIRVGETYSVAMNSKTEEIVIHQYKAEEHRIFVFKKVDGTYRQDRSVEIDLGSNQKIRCHVAFAGDTILVVGGNGQVIAFDSATLKERKAYKPENRFPIETVAASSDGRWFALHYSNKYLWLLDVENDSFLEVANVRGQGGISSVSFNQDNQLCVIDRQDRVLLYEPETMSVVNAYSASGDFLQNAFRYCIKPMYTIFPKPGEFYKVVQHLSAARDTKENANVDLINTKVPPDPFAPLYSGLGFMVFMVGLSCLVFQYKDF